MKALFILACCVTILLFSIAGFLCYQGKEGWGWFLFAGLVVGGFSYNETVEKKDDNGKSKRKIEL